MLNITKRGFNVCMITHAFYPEYNGAATQCYYLSKNLVEINCRVMIAAFTNNFNLPSQQWIEGIDVRRIFVRKKGLTGPFTAIKLVLLLIKESRRFDIIHFHGFNNHLLWIVWLNLFLRKKIILKMSLMNYDTPKAIMANGIFYRLAYRKIDVIIATTSAMMDELNENPLLKGKGAIIANGVDIDKFTPANKEEKIKLREKLGLPKASKIIIFSGAVTHRKGIDILLSTWEMLYQKLSGLCPSLLIVGPFREDIAKIDAEDEQTKKIVMEIVEKYPEYIYLPGMKQNIEDYYRASDLFVLPSRNEGLPNALLEAMACGLNCVVTDFPGIDDLAVTNGGLRIIYRVKDENGLFGTLIKALQDSEIGNLARQWIISKFSMEKVLDLYLKCYQEIR